MYWTYVDCRRPDRILLVADCGTRCMARRCGQSRAVIHAGFDDPCIRTAAGAGHSRLVAGQRGRLFLRRPSRISHGTTTRLLTGREGGCGRPAARPPAVYFGLARRLTDLQVIRSSPAKQVRQSRPLRLRSKRARKVRTPQGRVMANGHPWQHAEQGNRKQTADGPAQAGIR